MKICLILEGSYPYVHGGVSTWMHQYIKEMKEHEFVLWVIGALSGQRGRYVYELPENVSEIHEVFLEDALHVEPEAEKSLKLTEGQRRALEELIDCRRPDWGEIFSLFQDRRLNPGSFLMSWEFLEILTELCRERYPYIAFAEVFHTCRSMLLPMLYLLGQDVPEADMYHSVCTGYGGLLGVLAQYKWKKPLLLTEHGIYSREREEELIRARWVIPSFKKHWIRFFYMLSDAVYRRADRVTCLFENVRKIQIELGADPDRCMVIRNGIFYERFAGIPMKADDGWVDIGAMVRMAPIKDIKTMIYAFHEVASRIHNVRLHIMGGVDDEEYADECYSLAEQMKLDRIVFTGLVDAHAYMEKLDFTILTSISEGQPLSVLESLAAGRPCVTTDVGCCRELLEGDEEDRFGPAGYCVPPMCREDLARAMIRMCEDRAERIRMGENGRLRVSALFRHETMMEKYRSMYKEVWAAWQESGLN